MEEIWKDIKGFKNYRVSNFGRIKSLAHRKPCRSRSGKKFTYMSKERILKPIKKAIGYTQVNLYANRKHHIKMVHRLVAEAFIPNPYNKPQVNHKDGNGFNNHVDNLEWSTPSENGKHSYRVLGNKPWQTGLKGRNCPWSKPVLQKNIEGKIIKRWDCGRDAVRQGRFDSGGISKACNRIQKTHKGFIWEYA